MEGVAGKTQKTLEPNEICRRCPFWNEEHSTCCRTSLIAEALDALLGRNYSACELFEADEIELKGGKLRVLWDRHRRP